MKITLRPYQARFAAFLEAGGLRAVPVAHRRAGKDLTALRTVYRMAAQRSGTYFYMLPLASHARKVIWLARLGGERLINIVFPPAAVEALHETEMRVTLKNGSVIWFVGSDNYDRLVGTAPVGMVFSEYALAREQGWQLMRPILQENKGWACFLSTPRGRNHLHRIYEVAKGDPSWFADLLTIHDTKALPPEILESERGSGMPDSLIRQEYLCAWEAAQVGSVYGDLLEALAKRNGITTWDESTSTSTSTTADAGVSVRYVEAPAKRPGDVFTAWDLGLGDATAIWFWRIDGDRVDVIDYLEDSGKPLSFYTDAVLAKPYKYVAHYLPHDARARSYQTGVTTLELARERLGQVMPLPIMPIAQGIEAARWLLQQEIRIHSERCAAGLEALRQYSYAFDEETRCFSTRPEHSVWSHGADAFRYLATAVRVSIRMARPTPKEKKTEVPPGYTAPLEQLFKDREDETRPTWRKRRRV